MCLLCVTIGRVPASALTARRRCSMYVSMAENSGVGGSIICTYVRAGGNDGSATLYVSSCT